MPSRPKDVQNEANLHKYFPNHGRDMGAVLVQLAAVRNVLVEDRGDAGREHNDGLHNQVFLGRMGKLFDLEKVGFENATISLTGCRCWRRQWRHCCRICTWRSASW